MNIDRYAVFGHPIAHSKSPFIHRQFAQATDQRMDYQPILAPLDHFTDTLQLFFTQGGKGCNITLPFKEEAYQACTQHTERAQAAKAVNTIKHTHEGLLGDNTDGAGLLADLYHHVDLTNKHILILGAGGATRGVLLPLIQAKPASITIANRTREKAILLCEEFSSPHLTLQAAALTQQPRHAIDMIINATSASLYQQHLHLPDRLFASATLAYDMMYSASPSPFLQQAARCHIPHTVDGLGMLVNQAAEAFYVWRGIYPDTTPVLSALRAQLIQNTAQ